MTPLLLETRDNKKIATHLYNNPGAAANGWIVYIHMMPATKESWRDLAESFEKLGYVGLAVDLRGHGESGGGPNGYESFSEEEHRASKYDLEVAVKHFESGGAPAEKIFLIGASIGANLSLQYVADNPEHKTAVLLSPGLNYAGIETEPLVKSLQPDHRILFASSRDDRRKGHTNAEENEKLFSLTPGGISKKLLIYEHGGHGTTMLQTNEEPDLKEAIIKFISNG